MPATGTIHASSEQRSLERRGAAVIVGDAVPSTLWSAVAHRISGVASSVEVVVVAAEHPLMSAMYVVDAHLCLVPEGLVDVGGWAREEAERADALLQDALCALSLAGLCADGRTSSAPAHRVLRSLAMRIDPPAVIVLARARPRRADARAARQAEQRGVLVDVLTSAPTPLGRRPADSTRR